MNTIESIELFTAINVSIIGLSHFFQPKIWVDFFKYLYKKKEMGNIINAFMSLGMGSLILSFHFVWSFPEIFITLYALSQIIKGFTYLLFPSVGISSISRITEKSTIKFKCAGGIMFLFSLFIFYNLYNI